ECPVTNGVDSALLLARVVDVGGDRLQNDDIVSFDDLDDLALDVGETFLDQGRPDDPAPHGSELEPGELVRVRPGARADTDQFIEHVDRGNGNDALPVLS